MEKRKLMALGRSSLVIAIPKHWLSKSKLDRGDMVSLTTQSDGSLSVHPDIDVKSEREVILSVGVDEVGNSLIRRIISCYLNGFTTINLKSNNIFTPKQQTAIRSVVKTLYMRIMESNSRRITIRTLLDESMGSVVSGIERMHIITNSMCSDILNAIKTWDVNQAKSLLTQEEDVDQFAYFILRLIRRASLNSLLANKLGLDMLDCLDYQTLVHRIEQVADHVTYIANNLIALIEKQMEIPEGILAILIEAAELAFTSYDSAVKSFLSINIEETNEIIDNQDEIEDLGNLITPIPYSGKIEERANLCPICAIRESIKRISEYSADIAELTIDRAYKP